MNRAAADPLYRAAPAEEVARRSLGGLTLLYHRRSGQTHIVAEPVPQILDMLAEGPLRAGALAAALSERYKLAVADEAAGESAEALAQARLEELAALGLVERS